MACVTPPWSPVLPGCAQRRTAVARGVRRVPAGRLEPPEVTVSRSPWSRRQFLGALGAGGAAALGAGSLASCSSAGSGSGSASGDGGLTFTLWGGDEELAAFKAVADAYQQAEGTTVTLNQLPYADVLPSVDSRIQAGDPPDLFRVSYIDIGRYTTLGVLADISDALPSGYSDAFTPALWKAVQDPDGKPVGVPHHTDCSAIVYNAPAFAAAGITAPTSLDQAWTWEQFTQVLTEVKGANGGKYPVAVNWQAAGAYRWLSFLAQAGGSVFNDDLSQVTIASDAGKKALTYTQGLYTAGLHDPTFLVQAANYPDETFPTGQPLSIATGDFNLPSLVTSATGFEWGATYLPRDAAAATDLGGNAVVVTDGPNAEAAAKFAAFLANAENMKSFCEATTVLPTRSDVTGLTYAVRPDLMPVFVEQATTIPASLVAASTSPVFTQVNQALQQQLEGAFAGGADVDATLENLQQAIEQALQQQA
ncbi:extracellular solute-binding protein [Quadrisphaera setariae]|uniref:Extracellular solute-binding protein n=1 Tax=Quadrisphaera setariae TaxID=2593304 RepID=A0A5C8Z672_9ACTN|nr:extracellular solute-binding protein [Quadrisphaera setariae]